MASDSLLHNIAFSFITGLGCRGQRQLLKIEDNPETLFNMDKDGLQELFGNHNDIISSILSKKPLERAEQELNYCQRNNIRPLFCTDADFPQRMNRPGCTDTPTLIYTMGNYDPNHLHSVAIVGTRRATEYGKSTTNKIVEELSNSDIMVVSGLAYGIDTAAHKAALNHKVSTVGVLGHGLDIIYPSQNRELAKKMLDNGGLVTEYPSGTAISPGYFPARNRIIAAMSDAVIVIEASEKGGALITANIADSYHRDVFAVPGRIGDTYSQGCNNLIADNKAYLLRNSKDMFYILGWEKPESGKQIDMFFAFDSPEQQSIYDLLKESGGMTIDELAEQCELSVPKIAAELINLELKGCIKCLPGKLYKPN